jgi:hypothetical protein
MQMWLKPIDSARRALSISSRRPTTSRDPIISRNGFIEPVEVTRR